MRLWKGDFSLKFFSKRDDVEDENLSVHMGCMIELYCQALCGM